MAYKVLITRRAKKDIDKLDRVIAKKIKSKLILLEKEPIKLSKKLVNSELGTYRFRVGNHRIIFDIEEKTILVLRIGHRREIYR